MNNSLIKTVETKAKKKWEIIIDKILCKGCAICVDFCPTDVLAMEGGLAVVKESGKCSGCQICDHRCPDFAIQVFEV